MDAAHLPVGTRRPARGGLMFVVLVGAWGGAYFVARMLLEYGALPTWVRAIVAAAAVVVLSLVFTLVIRALARADELERLIHLLAAGIALPLVAVTVVAIALLQDAGLLGSGGGAGVLWPFLTFYYIVGYGIARAHYHDLDEDLESDTDRAGQP
jgi:hypothetical protein